MKIPIDFRLNLVYGNVVSCRYEADYFPTSTHFSHRNVSRSHPASHHRKLKLKTGVCQPLLMVMRVFSLVAFYEAGNMVHIPSSFQLLLTPLRMPMPHILQKVSKGSNTRELYIANLVSVGCTTKYTGCFRRNSKYFRRW